MPAKRKKNYLPNRAAIDDLDRRVDEWSATNRLLNSGILDRESGEWDRSRELLDTQTERILESLQPYLIKYVLLFSGRIEQSGWTNDTIRLVRLFSGNKTNQISAHMDAINRVRRLVADYCVEDASQVGQPEYFLELHSMPIYYELVVMTLEVLRDYKIVRKKENGERINFLYVYLTRMRFKINHWITSLGRDYMCWNSYSRVDPKYGLYETDVAQSSSGVSDTFQEFEKSDELPWVLLTKEEKEILWMITVRGVPFNHAAEQLGMNPTQVRRFYLDTIESCRQIMDPEPEEDSRY